MILIVLPISRKDYLKPVFDCLAKLIRSEDTELLIITDGDKELEKAVDRRLDSISYKKIQVVSFGEKASEDIDSRRWRISEIHNKARHYVPYYCDYIFSVEDDTVYPDSSLAKMLDIYDTYEDCGFVEGVELGRHKTKYVGAWIADDLQLPSKITSVMPTEGLQEIDAGGLYCALIKADLYRRHNFQPYDTEGKNGLSCDVNLGLWIRRQGYKCLIDWSIKCDHIGDKGSVNLGNTKPVTVVFEKRNSKWNGRTEV